MSEFSNAFSRIIQSDRIGARRFSDIIERLANDGVIVLGDSNVESELYENAIQIEDEIADYFGLLGCVLHHNPRLGYFRLFPRGAKSPCVVQAWTNEAELGAVATGLRRRGNPHVSAALLALRALYQQKIATGDLASGFGEV